MTTRIDSSGRVYIALPGIQGWRVIDPAAGTHRDGVRDPYPGSTSATVPA